MVEKKEDQKVLKFKVQKEGFSVELEGPFEYVKNYFENLLPEKQLKEMITTQGSAEVIGEFVAPQNLVMDAFPDTTKGRVVFLKEAGFFKTPRTLGEITEQLSREGYFYNSKTVDNALRVLVQEQKLRRIGKRGEYRYVQR
ncbi:MAG: hypothetical protein ACW976_04980 [Candidatus Ranarchaeia archaeon]|jgi:hypothetical protein